jgi:hypothetical protein
MAGISQSDWGMLAILAFFWHFVLASLAKLAKFTKFAKRAKPWKSDEFVHEQIVEIFDRWSEKQKESFKKSRKKLPSPPSTDFYMLCNTAYSQNDVKFAFTHPFAKFATFAKFAQSILTIFGFVRCVDFGKFSQNQLASLAINRENERRGFWQMWVLTGIGKNLASTYIC